MKKLLKSTLLLTMTLAIILSCTTNVFAATINPKMLAEAVLRGQNIDINCYSVRGSIPLEVKINPDNPDEVINNFGGTASKEEFIKYLNELTNEDILKVKSYGSINNMSIFDEPNNRDCTDCPGRALERAKGTFYQDYVYNYWKQYTEAYAIDTGHGIPSVEAFFAVEGITLNTATSQFYFNDLPFTHWATSTITKIASLGYFSGYEDGSFKPDNHITHEEFTKVVAEILGLKITSVTGGSTTWASWAQPYLNAALDAGIITKSDTDLLAASMPITRGEMAKLIGRVRVYLKRDDNEGEDLNGTISDWNAIPDEYKPYIAKAYNAGIINGYGDGSFKPDGKLTRAEAATVFMKLIDEKADLKLFVNGNPFNLSDLRSGTTASDIEPIITDIDILVPLQQFREAFNIDTEFDANTEAFIFEKDGYGTCRIVLHSDVVEKKDGDKWTVCAEDIEPSTLVNDRTVVPLLAIVKALGMDIRYDKDTNIAEINYVDAPTP